MTTFSRSDLADLHVFLTIARRGSFRQAANELGLTTSALSHTLKKLEAKLEVRLLNRTSRSVVTTQAGAELAEALSRGFETIGEALGVLESHRKFPIGRLRLNVFRNAAKLLVSPALPRFVETYPQIHLDLSVEDRPVDIVAEGFDAGIRYGATVPRDMIATALTPPLRWVVAGSPAYLARKGRPRVPDDLHAHSCVQMRIGDSSTYAWELGDEAAMVRVPVPGSFQVNDADTGIDAALNGVGLVYCLEARIRQEVAAGALEIVMPDWSSMGPPMVLYYPSRRQLPAGLRQLAEILRRCWSEHEASSSPSSP